MRAIRNTADFSNGSLVMRRGFCLLSAVMLLGAEGMLAVAATWPETLYYEREMHTETASDTVRASTTSVTKVWVQGALRRVEIAQAPGSPRRAFVETTHGTYALNLDEKTAVRMPVPSVPTERQGDLRDYRRSLIEAGARAAGEQTIAAEEAVGVDVPSPTARGDVTWRVWFSKRTGLPIEERIAQADGTVTVRYKNVTLDRSVAPTFFEIPPDFKITDGK